MTIEFSPSPPVLRLPRAKYLLFAAIAAMYLYVVVTTEKFLIDPADPNWRHIAPFRDWLLPHSLSAVFALLLGPLQFSERLRRRYLTAHKVMGYLYIAGCYIGAPLGIYIQWFEERMGASRNFTMASTADATVWIFATSMALYFVRRKKIELHRRWMTRSFACALIFLEVRAVVAAFHVPIPAIEMVVWWCVALAFPIADLVLQAEELMKRRPLRAA